MNWNDAARAAVIAFLVMIANGLLFQFNRWLFNTYRIEEAGFEYGYVGVAVVPAALTGLVLILAGFRSRLWWWLFAPGLLLWALRPLRGRDGWGLNWAFDELLDYLSWVIFHFEQTPDHAFAALNSAVVIAMITAVLIGQSIRFTRKALRQRFRDGGIRGPGGGSASGRSGTAQLPQARWASRSEVRARFSHPGGIVLGEMTDPLSETPNFKPGTKQRWRNRQGRGDLITMDPEDGNGHVLVLAASAGFKTSGIVIPNILNYKQGPIVVFDPKGDLYARTKDARKAMGYKAVVINAEHGFDPFKMIAPLSRKVPSAYYTLAKTLMPLNQRASDVSEYFHEMSVSLFAALTAHFVAKNKENVAHSIAQFFSQPREEVIDQGVMIAAEYDLPFINDELKGLAALDERTFPGVAKGITNKLSFIQFPDIARYATSERSPEDHLKACDPDTDIFISLPSLAAKDFSPFPRLLIGSMFVVAELMEQPDRPRARRLFLIDEARVLGGMDVLTNVRDAGRSLGMHLMLIYQNLGQVIEAWGGQAGADAWVDSCEARIVSAVGSSRNAADISAMLGKRTIRVTTEGSSSQAPIMTPMGGSMGATENEQLREIPLLTQSELGQLPAHASVIFTRRSRPILATKAIWFTRKDMQPHVKSPESVEQELDVTKRRTEVLESLDSTDQSPKQAGPRTGETTASTEEPAQKLEPAESAPRNTSHAKPGRTGVEAASAEQPAQKTLPLSQPAPAVTTTAPRSRGNPEEKIVPSNALTSSDQPETKEPARLTRSGITCDTRDGCHLVPDPDMRRDFAEWVLRQKEAKPPAETEPSGQSISDENVSDVEGVDLKQNPPQETGMASSTAGSDHAEAATVRSDRADDPEDQNAGPQAQPTQAQPTQAQPTQAQPTQAPETPGSNPAVSGNTEQDETNGQRGEGGDEAGKKENEQDRQPRSTASVEAQKLPQASGAAQGDQAAPQGSDIPDPSASRRRAQTEEPSPAPARGLNDGLWQEPPAFWGELGIPREVLEFGRKPPRDPATLPRWLRPFWNATIPLRRLWVRVMLPTGDIPLNLRPYTMEIIPRPHDATEGSWLLRKWDILDWYLSHPGDRYNVYDHKLRRRRESILRWRLRAWLRGRAPGKPPWLDNPYP